MVEVHIIEVTVTFSTEQPATERGRGGDRFAPVITLPMFTHTVIHTPAIPPRKAPWIQTVPCVQWRHQMETFSALLAFCVGNSPVTGEFPTQRSVTRSFDVLFDQRLNKQLSKQSWGWRFEMPSRSLWRQCNVEQPSRGAIGHQWHNLFILADGSTHLKVLLGSRKFYSCWRWR